MNKVECKLSMSEVRYSPGQIFLSAGVPYMLCRIAGGCNLFSLIDGCFWTTESMRMPEGGLTVAELRKGMCNVSDFEFIPIKHVTIEVGQ